MVANKEERIKIDLQLESFKHAKGLFGFENAILMRNKKTPALNPNVFHNSDEDVDEVEYNKEFSGSPTHIRSSFQGPSSKDDEDEHEFANDRDDEGHNDGDYEFANARVDFQRMGDENAHANDASDDLGARHIDECSFSTGWKPWNKTIDEHDGDVLTFEIEEPDDAIFLVKESSNHDADRTLAYCFWG
ncbi:eukaryotic translation initiation factor 3subunit C-like protein [Striga asiatica]|uniref:Eukaryotic translation initiation factor 3subunit C-like protein n=1 Tax=Striga asiatica TaxID=4170 RepID=A0A5A7P9Y4_STRAF|nr:eukaryotic translation initiation factor 3subunit C-like protein [Striga asiatica]